MLLRAITLYYKDSSSAEHTRQWRTRLKWEHLGPAPFLLEVYFGLFFLVIGRSLSWRAEEHKEAKEIGSG